MYFSTKLKKNLINLLDKSDIIVDKDIDPTSLTDASFNLAFNSLALGLRTLFQQNPSLFRDYRFFQP